jgi:adenine-specific DNA-methyltransferase
MSGDRCDVLARVFGGCGLGLVFANAFKSRQELQGLLDEPPWGTAAWFANEPEHMIHFNGQEFFETFESLAASGMKKA